MCGTDYINLAQVPQVNQNRLSILSSTVGIPHWAPNQWCAVQLELIFLVL